VITILDPGLLAALQEEYSDNNATPLVNTSSLSLGGLYDFCGNKLAVSQLKLAINSALIRNERLDHVLLTGFAGTGKSTLARLVANEMGVNCFEISGKVDVDDAAKILGKMQDHDVLFFDEIHTLGSGTKSAWMLPLLQDQILLTPRGAIKIPDITVIGATTDSGLLSDALLSRFVIKPVLQPYTKEEATQIALTTAKKLDVTISYEEAERLAVAGNENPRNIGRLLSIARDIQITSGVLDLDLVYRMADVTFDGLDVKARSFMLALLAAPGNRASQASLGAMLGESGPLGHIERRLVSRGYVTVEPRGRALTPRGRDRAVSLARNLGEA
jgi:Holliday junction DNA helicase RuvB